MSNPLSQTGRNENPLANLGSLLIFFGVLWALFRAFFMSDMDIDLDWDEFRFEMSLYGFLITVGLTLICIGLRSTIKGTVVLAVISGAAAGLLLIGVIGGTALAWVAG